MDTQLLWIPLLPFIGFLLNGLFGKRFGPRLVSWIGCLAPLGALALTYTAWRKLTAGVESIDQTVFPWIWLDGLLEVPFKLLFDPLSASMCLVITGVGSLIHLYSIGYMRGDPGYHRFFAYLNLFTAFMLILVLADNLLLMFVGWEGVGLCSYLLIGFWYEDDANCAAGKKAFIVNRIGDFGFLLGMFLCVVHFNSLDFSVLTDPDGIARVAASSAWGLPAVGATTLITVLFFIGATGKSAQIPLYVWLPDAMAGPTPVSALIHAATMVTSGIYLCCRLMPLFESSPWCMALIAGIGASTALLAALIAFSQNDIKKVLAYSTVSQLGYMFFAVGMGAFSAAFFHLVTHAFFKALLFLGSGAVIHAMHHEQDMRKMGGLKQQLPFTHLMFLIGTLAIAGMPPFAGFFSKDEILFAGFLNAFGDGASSQAQIFWAVSFLTAGMTAFYMLRCLAMTFWGESRVSQDTIHKVHEPGGWIAFALFVLAIASTLGGFLGVPAILGGHNIIGHFTGLHLEVTGLSEAALETHHAMEWTSMVLSLLMAASGLLLGYFFYGKYAHVRDTLTAENSVGARLKHLSANKFFVDELYHKIVVRPFEILSWLLFFFIDRLLIDWIIVEGTALVTRATGNFFRRMQTGIIPGYLMTFGCGVLVLLYILLNILSGNGS